MTVAGGKLQIIFSFSSVDVQVQALKMVAQPQIHKVDVAGTAVYGEVEELDGEMEVSGEEEAGKGTHSHICKKCT